MFTSGALKQLIALEEKKPDHGQLITSAYDTDEFFVQPLLNGSSDRCS
jgi:hypothetical protein